jgi:hypothetical protein
MSLITRNAETETFREMDWATFQFHLTGSRYFGRHSADSDWDFFVEDQPDLRDWLECHGFSKESNDTYAAADVSEVWKHGSFAIHVQITIDARLKSAVQEILFAKGLSYTLYNKPKNERGDIWNVAIALYRAGQSAT